MTIINQMAKLGLVLGAAAVLTACGGAPSDSQVRQVLEEQIERDLAQLSGIAGQAGLEDVAKGMMPKVEDISPQGCEAADNDVYICTVEATVTMMGVQNTEMQDFRFKKNNDGDWKVIR
ncbi:MAG: hypothetical protein ACTHXN_08055 [Oceanisphaera sp.]